MKQWGLIIPDLTTQPSAWVKRFSPLIPKGGFVLDLACGSGRHTQLLAQNDYLVLAVDRDIKTIQSNLPEDLHSRVQVSKLDLEGESWPLGDFPQFDGVVVTNYLYRPHLDKLLSILTPGGVLIYETFALGNEQFGRPSNPDFLLKPNELLALVEANSAFQIVSFEQGLVKFPKPASIQRICAVKSPLIPLQLNDER